MRARARMQRVCGLALKERPMIWGATGVVARPRWGRSAGRPSEMSTLGVTPALPRCERAPPVGDTDRVASAVTRREVRDGSLEEHWPPHPPKGMGARSQ